MGFTDHRCCPVIRRGVAGAYFGGYLRKKGENLATHEDIRKLTDQVAAVTTTTEQIKTEISDAAWNRQRTVSHDPGAMPANEALKNRV